MDKHNLITALLNSMESSHATFLVVLLQFLMWILIHKDYT